jgi:hypothetical protein
VPFHRLFAFADGADAALMALGSLGAAANGAALPLMTVLFGRLVDAFGGAAAARDVARRVSAVSLQFVYLAVASAVASFLRKRLRHTVLCAQSTDTALYRCAALLTFFRYRPAQRWRAG